VYQPLLGQHFEESTDNFMAEPDEHPSIDDHRIDGGNLHTLGKQSRPPCRVEPNGVLRAGNAELAGDQPTTLVRHVFADQHQVGRESSHGAGHGRTRAGALHALASSFEQRHQAIVDIITRFDDEHPAAFPLCLLARFSGHERSGTRAATCMNVGAKRPHLILFGEHDSLLSMHRDTAIPHGGKGQVRW